MSDVAPIFPYRPLTFGQILERTFRLLRSNFRSLMGTALVPGLALLLTYGVVLAIFGKEIISGASSSNPEDMLHLMRVSSLFFVPVMLINLVVFALYLAAAFYSAVLADCGQPVTSRDAYRIAWSRKGHYVLLILAIYAITFLPPLLLEIPMFATLTALGGNKAPPNPTVILLFPVEILFMMIACVAGAIIALRLSLAFPASVFGSLKVREAIKRSWNLTRGALGRIFLVALVVYAAIYAAIMVLVFAVLLVGLVVVMFTGTQEPHSQNSVTVLIGFAVVAYLVIIAISTAGAWAGFTTAFAVIYNDQRLRLETQPPVTPEGVPA
jgi:hypothetical protein